MNYESKTSYQGEVAREKQKWSSLSEQILERWQNGGEFFNLARIKEYFTSLGLTNSGNIVVLKDKTDLATLRKLFDRENFKTDSYYDEDDWTTLAYDELGLIFVKAFELPQHTDPVEQERWLVHEFAHLTHRYKLVSSRAGNIYLPRYGFMVDKHGGYKMGIFLEEGFAEMLAADYRACYAGSQLREELAGSASADLSELTNFPVKNGVFQLPLKYATRENPEDSLFYEQAAPAGYALELLCRDLPNFRQYLLTSRYSVEGLRAVAKDIESLSPGLYKYLLCLKYKPKDFKKGYDKIIEVLNNKFSH